MAIYFLGALDQTQKKKVKYDWDNRGFAGDSVYFCQKDILDSFSSGKASAHSGLDYLRNLKIEETIYISNKNGKRYTII